MRWTSILHLMFECITFTASNVMIFLLFSQIAPLMQIFSHLMWAVFHSFKVSWIMFEEMFRKPKSLLFKGWSYVSWKCTKVIHYCFPHSLLIMEEMCTKLKIYCSRNWELEVLLKLNWLQKTLVGVESTVCDVLISTTAAVVRHVRTLRFPLFLIWIPLISTELKRKSLQRLRM